MNITVVRRWKKPKYTIGELYVDGKLICNTLEDTDRGLYQGMEKEWILEKKVPTQTAIPYGRYKVTLQVKSPKYSKKKSYEWCGGYMPRLMNVPGFEGVLIHPGNDHTDTEGCILVGDNKAVGKVLNSQKIFKELYALLKEAEGDIWLNIVETYLN